MTAHLPTALAALITPFTAEGNIDLDSHQHNVAALAAAGLPGLLIGGSTGEGPYLESGERGSLIQAARAAHAETYVMAGVAAETTRAAHRQLVEVAEAGADSALVLTPTTMARHDPAAVNRFFASVLEASEIPVLLYSVPKWTAYELAEPAVVGLSQHPRAAGMKDSGGDVGRLSRLVDRVGSTFAVYNGSSAVLGPAMWIGAYGGITASGNYAPDLLLDVVEKQQVDDHRRLAKLAHTVEQGGIPAVKAAAAASGLRPGAPRAPLAPADPVLVERFRRLFDHP